MLLGLHIDIWYQIVGTILVFVIALAILAAIVANIRDWWKWRKVGQSYKELHYNFKPMKKGKQSDSNKNKSGR